MLIMNTDITPPNLQGRFPAREHEHKWYPWQTKTPFEAVKVENGVTYFTMIEWAYFNCNCGEALKSKVKIKNEG